MLKRKCAKCDTMIEREPLMLFGREWFPFWICDSCEARDQAEQTRVQHDAAEQKRTAAWQRICPPLYQDTDVTRLPAELRDIINTWRCGPRGLGLFGAVGQGKTRACYQLLKRCHDEDLSCHALTATRFAMASADQYSDDTNRRQRARHAIEACSSADVLFLDDLGKNKFTERVELDLFDVLEHRTSHLLPTLWTANATGDALAAMLSPDRGAPILRRLVEFSQIVKTG